MFDIVLHSFSLIFCCYNCEHLRRYLSFVIFFSKFSEKNYLSRNLKTCSPLVLCHPRSERMSRKSISKMSAKLVRRLPTADNDTFTKMVATTKPLVTVPEFNALISNGDNRKYTNDKM